MMHALAIMGVSFGAMLELHSIPLEDSTPGEGPSQILTFFADVDSDAVADLFILEGTKLSVVSRVGAIHQTVLPHGVSAFDIADIDGDGAAEVIAVQGRTVFRIPIALQGDPVDPNKMFSVDSLYATAYSGPLPTVLVTKGALGDTLIALPMESGLSRFAVDGTPVDETPYTTADKSFYSVPRSLVPGTVSSGLSIQYLSTTTLEIDSPSYPAASGMGYTYLSPELLREARAIDPRKWPWFEITADDTKQTRVYCAVDSELHTILRIADVALGSDGAVTSVPSPGPERRYPGALVPGQDREKVDFNGDGYADILLWNAPRPGISVDSLLRAVTGRDWPITLTVHLYSPDKGRFEPMSATKLEFRIPVTWFLAYGVPLRDYVLRDIDGDGKTDLAMCTEESHYAVWLYREGFTTAPDEKHVFPEPITGIEHAIDIEGNGKTSIVLRGDSRVYALYAK